MPSEPQATGPLYADHPAVGQVCPKCGKTFSPGDSIAEMLREVTSTRDQFIQVKPYFVHRRCSIDLARGDDGG